MSNATAELRSALSALCTIVECSLTRLPSGTISPELFRQAKNDDKNATGPLTALLDAMVMESLQLSNIKQAVELLCIAPPSDWKSSAALLTIFALLLHRLNFVDEQFRFASRTSEILRIAAIGGTEIPNDHAREHNGDPETNIVFTAGKIRKLAAMLKTSKYPPLPMDLCHLSYEEFVISQSPDAVSRLDSVLDRHIKIVTNFFVWNEKESVFWNWIRQSFNSSQFTMLSGQSETALDSDAAGQIARIDRIEAALAKLAKPKFRPDLLKARSNRTLALMGDMNSNDNGPPIAVKKLRQEIEALTDSTSRLLDERVRNLDKNIIPVFP